MPTQLTLYNKTLMHLKSQSLSSTSEAAERRRVLDIFYADTIERMLECGFWKFAMRTVKIDYDTATTPAFGQPYAFTKPEDWKKTYWLSGNDRGEPGLDGWVEDSNMWFADGSPIYVRYVSNDADYGLALDRWTGRFEHAFTLELAYLCSPKISGDMTDKLVEMKVRALSEALAHEALREPVRRPPEGSWNAARGGSQPKRYPGGLWGF